MKMFTDCSGECCVCKYGDNCSAGHGDDDYCDATKEQVIERLNNGSYAYCKEIMIAYLRDYFNYEYKEKKN